MEIVTYGHPCLRWKSKPITEITPELKATVRKMFELMYSANGIGLAANQVGLPYRFFVVNPAADADEPEEEMVFINPEIVRRKGSVIGEEGCLSLPELYGDVPRAEEIVVEAFDMDGQGFEVSCSELVARVIQHESDHLDGVLFIDRMEESEREELSRNLDDFARQFQQQQTDGKYASDTDIEKRLAEMEQTFEFPDQD